MSQDIDARLLGIKCLFLLAGMTQTIRGAYPYVALLVPNSTVQTSGLITSG